MRRVVVSALCRADGRRFRYPRIGSRARRGGLPEADGGGVGWTGSCDGWTSRAAALAAIRCTPPRLRPTGMVVFATVDGPARRRLHTTVPVAPARLEPGQWLRRRAAQGACWLLGR